MEILYLDNKIIVCVKPQGVLSTDEEGGLPSLLRQELGQVDAPLYTVHRLDAAVGGLMVLARTRHAASDLGKAVQGGQFHKEYWTVVHGAPPAASGTLRDLLRRDREKRMTCVVAEPDRDAREAVLDYTVLAEREGLSLVRVQLRTGRTHQIRCQFASRGLPIWGDKKYGLPGDVGEIALWSHALGFAHPATGELLLFEKAPPKTWPWTAFEEE